MGRKVLWTGPLRGVRSRAVVRCVSTKTSVVFGTIIFQFKAERDCGVPADAYVNHGHSFSNNAVYDYGKRVGHGSGLWFFQAGNTTVSHNEIVEGPRDAFGVYGQRFGCFGPAGAGSLTCGEDCNHPGVVKKLYGEPCDFWCGLRALTTQWIEISYNKVANVVRDTSDAGALE
jgi:hypothetical protein